jgi:glycine cleavage system H lipoate-binding protein
VKAYNIILILSVSAALSVADDAGFNRYQLILDRKPFGAEPPENEVVKVPASQSFARNLRLSMLFEGPDGTTRVGIVDSATQKSYILRIGEPQDGLEVVEADVKSSEAMIRKDSEVALFKLESGEIASAVQAPQAGTIRRRIIRQRSVAPQPDAAVEPPQPQLRGEELRAHLERVQMDAIRNGLPPLPLPLTPEMDAQLVKEGVLPPQ